MSHRAHRRNAIAAAALALAMAGSARAADDDFEFADALSRRGYVDLSNEVYQSLINDPKSSPARKADGQYGLALLVYGEARLMAGERNDKRRKPMKDVLARFDDADKAFAKFIQDNATHVRSLEAKLSRGKLLQDKAEYVKTCVENDWLTQGESASAVMKQAAEWFDTAIQLFEAAEKKALDDKKALSAKHEDSGPAWDDAYDRHSLIWLYRIAALYGKGAALPKGDASRDAALNRCLKEGSDDYQWEYGETVRGLWAVHFAALACAALDRPADAFNMLKTAASFTAEKDSSPPIQDITFQSYRELGKACIAFGRREKQDWPANALKVFEGLPAAWPQWIKHPEGQRAGLVWAELIERAGQFDKAYDLVQRIVKAAEETSASGDALRALERMIQKGGGGVVGGDPDQLWKVAMNGWRSQEFAGTIRAFQAVLAACGTPEEMEKWGWQAWDYVGRCYYQLGRHYEAFLAWEEIEKAWRKEKANEKLTGLTEQTGWSRCDALNRVYVQSKDAADKAAFDRAMTDFGNDHPNSPYLQSKDIQEADNLMRTAETVRDDPAAYRVALQKAIDACAKIPESSTKYDLVRAKMIRARQAMATADRGAPDAAMLAQAVSEADAWLGAKRPEATESAVRTSRVEGGRIALLVALAGRADLADALKRGKDRDASVKAHQDLLSALDRLGPAFIEGVRDGQAKLDNWRAEGLIGVGKVDEADQLVGKLIESNPDSRNNLYLAALIGQALERLARERAAKEDVIGAKNLFIRSARRREWFLDNRKDRDGAPLARDPEMLRSIAECYANGGDFVKAEAMYAEAQNLFESQADTAKDAEAKSAALTRARTCRIRRISILVMQEKFDAAIPQLEQEVAKDPKDREAFLKKIHTTDNITAEDFRKMVANSDVGRTLLDDLSAAYMKAPSKERLFGAVNLCTLLNMTMRDDEKHKAEFIEFALRRAEAYVLLAAYTRLPEHYKAAAAAIRNGMVIPGFLDSYDQELPGAKKRAESALQKAEDGLRKVGAK